MPESPESARAEGRRPRLLVLSHVLPCPGASGQQQRVRYTLEAARLFFHVTFATCAPRGSEGRLRGELEPYCDESIILPALYARTRLALWAHRLGATAHALRLGVKRSNYAIGKVEFSPDRVARYLGGRAFDAVIFEYWHAAESTRVFQQKAIPCVLDMHNILWRAYDRQLRTRRWLPAWIRNLAVERYQRREEQSWRRFDGLVAINREEEDYVRGHSPGGQVFYAPMGVDLDRWPYRWSGTGPIRVGFYGGLGSIENRELAARCHQTIMPEIWKAFPEAELWLIGTSPPKFLQDLTKDPRVKVTGFVSDAGKVLETMSCVVCPWSGRYGFRSRLVEVMSVGVPVVASTDAVSGMELEHEKGILLADDDAGLARLAVKLLQEPGLARSQSQLARARMEQLFTMEKTYGKLMSEISDWLETRKGTAA